MNTYKLKGEIQAKELASGEYEIFLINRKGKHVSTWTDRIPKKTFEKLFEQAKDWTEDPIVAASDGEDDTYEDEERKWYKPWTYLVG